MSYHPGEAVNQAQAATKALYDVDPQEVDVNDVAGALQGDPRLVRLPAEELIGKPLTKLMASCGKVKSRGMMRNHVRFDGSRNFLFR
jgi:hypothetical protein